MRVVFCLYFVYTYELLPQTIAQLVERRAGGPEAAGSSPASLTIWDMTKLDNRYDSCHQ